jgi:hypothetical protein
MSESNPEQTGDQPEGDLEPDPTSDAEEVEAAIEAEGLDVPDGDGDGGGLLEVLNSGGIKQLLLQKTFQDPQSGHEYSQADLVADVVNVMRMDAKQMCALHDIKVEVDKMSPERSAELLEDVAKNEGVGIIGVFQQIEEKRDKVFRQKMTDEQYDQYIRFKESMLYSVGGSQ